MIIFYTTREGGEWKKANTTRRELKVVIQDLFILLPKHPRPYFVYNGSIYIPKANMLYDFALLSNSNYYWIWNRAIPPQAITYLRTL